jgi:histidine-containing phosphotransfer protein
MCSCRLRPEELTGLGWWQEVLDQQFTQLQQLQDESNPEFVSEVVTLFFEDSERLLEELTESL